VTENVNRYNLQLDNINSLQELVQELDEALNDVQLGVRKNEEIEDVAGAMFSNNSEDLIGLTYKDEDGTIDASGDLNNMTSLGSAPASGDLLAIYDNSADEHKSVTVTNLANAFTDGSIFDGDQLDIDFSPNNYTPDTSPSEASDADDLAAHRKWGVFTFRPFRCKCIKSGKGATFNIPRGKLTIRKCEYRSKHGNKKERE
jgi:hypothetical protein